ncbi:MAG: ATP-binding protein [Syntrophomonadaceae bacterium]|nr:ATP-binding protein [Syntrophomonadaceae bacterium]MDD3023129.1 ATP-binding protein [Syntrophomonadaceae bacterium]
MQIAVASGKGGTGKTLLSTCLMKVLSEYNPVLVDADVEEPNAGLVLKQQVIDTVKVNRLVPEIDLQQCNLCGKCAEICKFNALVVLAHKVLVFNELCHSCGACAYLCPEAAIKEKGHHIGVIEEADIPGYGTLLTGRLTVGEAQSPPLIKATKNKKQAAQLRIIDCPPGTTCAMIESIRDSDYCLLITEPTPFGLHDLELSLEAVGLLGIPGGLVINRWQGQEQELADLSSRTGIPVLARIPFSQELARAYMQGRDPLEAMPALRSILSDIMGQIKEALS